MMKTEIMYPLFEFLVEGYFYKSPAAPRILFGLQPGTLDIYLDYRSSISSTESPVRSAISVIAIPLASIFLAI